MRCLTVYISEIHDPAFNLAIEKWLFQHEKLDRDEVLFFYRNAPSVIMGRFQNPWLECDLKKIKEQGVQLIRRESGGGTVYHDLGNLNFSFMANKDQLVKEEKTRIVVEALQSLHINAAQGERNDIYMDTKKISGSAGRYTSAKALHHGTLLINADLRALESYLLAKDYSSEALQSKGIASISSKTTNINDFDPNIDYKKIIDAISRRASEIMNVQVVEKIIKEEDFQEILEVEETRELLKSWEWLYGKTPSFTSVFTERVTGKKYNCKLHVNKGLITEIGFPDEPITEVDKEAVIARYCSQPFDQLYHP